MNLGNGLIALGQRAPWLMKKVQSVPWLNSLLNGLIINAVVTKGAARPQPWSLWTPTPIAENQCVIPPTRRSITSLGRA